jgi:hypothetical protein
LRGRGSASVYHPRYSGIDAKQIGRLPVKGFIHASAHVHDVDGQTVIEDGETPVGIVAGFEVAPGDARDIQVANAHAWGSDILIFEDVGWAGSALYIARYPDDKGIASYFSK